MFRNRINPIILIFKVARFIYKWVVLKVFESHFELRNCVLKNENGELLKRIEETDGYIVESGFITYSDCIKYFKMSTEKINNIKNDYQREAAFRCIDNVYEVSEIEANRILSLMSQIFVTIFGFLLGIIYGYLNLTF